MRQNEHSMKNGRVAALLLRVPLIRQPAVWV
jgi:hypothetical protein